MWPSDTPCSISYGCSIVTNSLSPVIFEILCAKHMGSRPWLFKVTWRHWSRDDSIPHTGFPISAPLEPSPYLQALESYSTSNISKSRPWPFNVTWCHRSRDDSIPHMGFSIGAPLEPSPYLQAFSRYLAPNISGSRPWPFIDHVTIRFPIWGFLLVLH